MAPFIPYAFTRLVPIGAPQFGIELYQAVLISAVIAIVITVVAYKLAVKNARELLTKAET
jgi:hypothetical protein